MVTRPLPRTSDAAGFTAFPAKAGEDKAMVEEAIIIFVFVFSFLIMCTISIYNTLKSFILIISKKTTQILKSPNFLLSLIIIDKTLFFVNFFPIYGSA
jgi:hypothetical protein